MFFFYLQFLVSKWLCALPFFPSFVLVVSILNSNSVSIVLYCMARTRVMVEWNNNYISVHFYNLFCCCCCCCRFHFFFIFREVYERIITNWNIIVGKNLWLNWSMHILQRLRNYYTHTLLSILDRQGKPKICKKNIYIKQEKKTHSENNWFNLRVCLCLLFIFFFLGWKRNMQRVRRNAWISCCISNCFCWKFCTCNIWCSQKTHRQHNTVRVDFPINQRGKNA